MDKKSLINKIKEKKELSGISDEVISDALNRILKRYNILNPTLSESDSKQIIKEVRADLRLKTGRFQASLKDRDEILASKNVQDVLKTHISTKERQEDYTLVKKIISDLSITSILDLGCGLNPIALASKDIEYNASDITEDELSLIKKFFEKEGIKGKVFTYDLTKINEKPLPINKADLCILMKVVDLIQKSNPQFAESLLNKVDCKFFLISFATKKLSGKPMNSPKRLWFESLLKRKSLPFETFKTSSEIFYLIRNK